MARGTGLPGQNVDVDVAVSGNKAQSICQIWPKDWYSWTDRTVTTPDITGPLNLSTLTPVSAGDAGTLQIAVDTLASSATLGLIVVGWDSRGNPISASEFIVTTSGWATNSAGYFVMTSSAVNSDTTIEFPVYNYSGFNVLLESMTPVTTVNLHWRLF